MLHTTVLGGLDCCQHSAQAFCHSILSPPPLHSVIAFMVRATWCLLPRTEGSRHRVGKARKIDWSSSALPSPTSTEEDIDLKARMDGESGSTPTAAAVPPTSDLASNTYANAFVVSKEEHKGGACRFSTQTERSYLCRKGRRGRVCSEYKLDCTKPRY